MKRNSNNTEYLRAQKVASIYTQATGSNVQIFDKNFRPLDMNGEPGIEQSVCLHCADNAGCREMHINAIKESGCCGRPHIYQCGLGLMFWASSVYSEGKFSGALRGSGYVSDKVDNPILEEKCSTLCGETVSPEEFTSRISALPPGDMEKIESLAEMLLLCTESLSTGGENYHEILRLRSEQQFALSVLIKDLKTKYPEGSTLPGYPLDKERRLIAALQRGYKEDAAKLLNEILAVLILRNPNNFRYIQLRTLELAVLLIRAGENFSRVATENNTRSLRQIQEVKTIEEITGILHGIVENITGQITSFQGIPHALAMRKAEIFIRENITRKISLREIAGVAGLSPPYFSTIFKEEMGENLSRYINRLRVEKASKMILETNLSLSEISGACCFEDQSWFSKIFKAFTGMSPGKYRARRSRVDDATPPNGGAFNQFPSA